MPVVYKLDRIDGLSYIGITTNFKKRLLQHRRSPRFQELNIVTHSILFEGDYDSCEVKEREFIELYDTYRNGLNVTPTGKGKNENVRFNTLGFKFSEHSRKIMSDKAKSRKRKTGYKHSEETKAHWRRIRKGRIFAPMKLDHNSLVQEYNMFTPSQSEIDAIPTRTNKKGQTMFINSRPFNLDSAKLHIFAKIKSMEYNVTINAIKRVIRNAKSI